MVKIEKEMQMKPVQKLRVVCLASAFLALPSVVSAQSTPAPLPVISFTEETPMAADVVNQANVIVAAPVPPARPVLVANRKPVRSAANRVPAPRQVVVATARLRPVEPVRVAMVRPFWLTIGNGF